MTLREIIFNIQNLRRGGKQSDDNPLSDNQVAFMVHYFRSLLIRREINKGAFIPEGFVQTLKCVDVEQVDTSECEELVSGCKILRTKLKIPNPLIWNNDDGLTFVGGVDSSFAYSRSSVERNIWDKYAKYTGALSKYIFKNDYIYVTNEDYCTNIMIRAVFDNPEDVARFNKDGEICFDYHTIDYPAPMWMVNVITEMCLTQELKILEMMPIDEQNDNKDVQSQRNVS